MFTPNRVEIELSEGRKIVTVGVGGRFAFCTQTQAREVRDTLTLVLPLMVGDEKLEECDPPFQHVPALAGNIAYGEALCD